MLVANYEAANKFSYVAEETSRWMERVLGPEFHRYHLKQAWSPLVNLYEDETCLFLVADLAGIEPDTIDLRVQQRQLILSGERPGPRPPRGGKGACARDGRGPLRMHVMEIDHGPFLRTLELPEAVDSNAIEACYRNGFLWVKMPKSAPSPAAPK